MMEYVEGVGMNELEEETENRRRGTRGSFGGHEKSEVEVLGWAFRDCMLFCKLYSSMITR